MYLLNVGLKQRKVVHYKTFFYKDTNMVSEFKVLFSFSFRLFQIAGARLSQSDTVFFSFLFSFSCFKILARGTRR